MTSKFVSFSLVAVLIFGALALPLTRTVGCEPDPPFSNTTSVPDDAKISGAGENEGTRQTGTTNWTVIVYMSGDGSLSDNVDSDIEEMERVGSGDGLEVITLSDKNGNGDSRVLHVLEDRSETIMPSEINASWTDELNMGRPEILVEFVLWAAASYPAEHYLLDLWGHGSGWTGVCPDKGDDIVASELKTAFEELNAGGVHPDIVSMDACQMGMLELLYQLKGLADYSIASEKDVPSAGWPYHRLLQLLRDNSTMSPEDFGSRFIDEYILWGKANSVYSLTLSFIELDRLQGVATALDALSEELILDAGYFHPEISAARDLTEEYDGAEQYDLGHLASNLAATTKAGVFADLNRSLAAAIDDATIYEMHWTRVNDEPADNATGMSIWFPLYTPYYTGYLNLAICADTSWDEFLDAFDLVEGGEISSSPLTYNITSVDTDGDGLNDTINMHAAGDAGLTSTIDIYNSAGEIVHSDTFPPAVAHGWPPQSPGYYSAHVYLRNATGQLLNFTRVDNLTSETRYTISGRVVSNTGKGLGWVRISLNDSSTGYYEEKVADSGGGFTFELISPWQTDGRNLAITCHNGQYTQNITVENLSDHTEINFEIPEGPALTVPLMYLALAFDIIALALLAVFMVGRRKDAPDKKNEDANV